MGAVLKINPVEFSPVTKLLISGLILYFLHTHISLRIAEMGWLPANTG